MVVGNKHKEKKREKMVEKITILYPTRFPHYENVNRALNQFQYKIYCEIAQCYIEISAFVPSRQSIQYSSVYRTDIYPMILCTAHI